MLLSVFIEGLKMNSDKKTLGILRIYFSQFLREYKLNFSEEQHVLH